ncbi:AfsR/SARP family transcriptional regulator [Streptosporangium sp. KLBMP 9127]|nr:AfsR/SARP family transcriptional regulator [Streptosporangium sp. KLBMP 9127]
MFFRLLGPLRLGAEGPGPGDSPTCRGVLAVLLLNSGRELSAARLADIIWDDPPRSAMSNLRTYVGRIRARLQELGMSGRLTTTRGGGEVGAAYRLTVAAGECDLQVFTDRAAQARTALTARRFDLAANLLRRGLALWEGPACSNVSGGASLRGYIADLNEQGLLAREDYIEARLSLGMSGGLVGEIRGLLAEHPLRERVAGQLLRALYLGGDPHAALNEYSRLRRTLDEELGVDPSPPLRRLHHAMLRHDEDAVRAPEDHHRSLVSWA